MLSFSPRAVSKDLLSELPERSRYVLVERFGLGPKGVSRTLDSIGKEYGITRERIRQIENHGVAQVRESSKYAEHSAELNDLKSALHSLGALLSNETVLSEIADAKDRNHVVFLLSVGHQFADRRENNDFHARWHTDEQLADQIELKDQNTHFPEYAQYFVEVKHFEYHFSP